MARKKRVGALMPLLHRERPLGAAQQRSVDAFVKQARKAFRKTKSERKAAVAKYRLD